MSHYRRNIHYPVGAIVRYRAIETHLIQQAGCTRATAKTGAATLIQRFESASKRSSSGRRSCGTTSGGEKKLSELLGEQAWRESGLGSRADVDQLQRQISTLEQQIVTLKEELEERDQELDAARAANRELFTNVNKRH